MSHTEFSKIAVIIDDEPQVRKLLCTSLSSEQYSVFEAENGRLGLMEIAYRKPDVVLLDLGLPDMDGIEVLKRLRVSPGRTRPRPPDRSAKPSPSGSRASRNPDNPGTR